MQWRRVLNTAHLLFLFLMWNHIQSSSSSELMMVHPVGINTYFCEIAVTHLSPPLKSPIMLVFRWYLQTSQRPGRSLKKQYVQRSNTLPGIEVSRWNGIFFAKSWVVSCNFMFCYPYDAIHKPTKEIVLGLLAPFEALKPSLCAVFRTKGSVKPSLKAVTSHILDHDAALFCSSFLNFTTSFPPQPPSHGMPWPIWPCLSGMRWGDVAPEKAHGSTGAETARAPGRFPAIHRVQGLARLSGGDNTETARTKIGNTVAYMVGKCSIYIYTHVWDM